MIWPYNLVTCALFNTLHSQNYAGIGNRGGISRERFFYYAFLGSFCWYFLPGYIFQALSYFSWVCWIVPDNVVVNQLFGYQHGLGMSLITFDWSQVCFVSGESAFGLTNMHRLRILGRLLLPHGGLRPMLPSALWPSSGLSLPPSTTQTPGMQNT